MIHEQYQELFSAHLDGVLSPAEEAALQDHLAGCPDCRRELSLLEETIFSFQSLPDVRLPEGFGFQLHEKLLQVVPETVVLENSRRKNSFIQRLAASPWIPLGAAAALIFIVWTTYHPLLNGPKSDLAAQPGVMQKAVNETATSSLDQTISAAPSVPTAKVPAAAEKAIIAPSAVQSAPAPKDQAGSKTIKSSPAAPAQAEKSTAPPNLPAPAMSKAAPQSAEPAADQSLAIEQSQIADQSQAAPRGLAQTPAAAESDTTFTASMEQSAVNQTPGPLNRPLVVQTAHLSLVVTGTSFAQVSDRLAGLYIIEEIDPAKGAISLQVAKSDWDQTITRLGEMGKIENLRRSDVDITEDYQAALDQLAAVQLEQDQLTAQLASGDSDEKIDWQIRSHRLAGEAVGLNEQLQFLTDKADHIGLELNVQDSTLP